jgi:hypothetical protein
MKYFGDTSSVTMKAESTFRRLHREYEQQATTTKPTTSQTERGRHSKQPETSSPKPEIYESDSEEESEVDETDELPLKNYLRGSDKMKSEDYDIQDPESSLLWWKVSFLLTFK